MLARDSWEMVADCEKRLAGIEDPAEHMIEGILYVLDEIVRRPLHAHLFTEPNGSWVLSQTMAAENLHGICVQLLGAMPGLNLPSSRDADTRIAYLAEWILRILASYAIAPSQLARNRDDMRELLRTTLEPAVRALLGNPALELTAVTPLR